MIYRGVAVLNFFSDPPEENGRTMNCCPRITITRSIFPARPSFAHLLSNSTVFRATASIRVLIIDYVRRPWVMRAIKNTVYILDFQTILRRCDVVAVLFACAFVCPAPGKSIGYGWACKQNGGGGRESGERKTITFSCYYYFFFLIVFNRAGVINQTTTGRVQLSRVLCNRVPTTTYINNTVE